MDRSKVTGDFSSAYKLSRSTKDTKQRLHRRSLEWKEIRRDQADKRRNINTDLSPVLEGDQTQQRDKSYSGKTPTKATKSAATGTSAKKTNDRMDMLKKWKAEREQKKKEELQAKKGNVFRVSKNIDHKDTALFKKSQPSKNPVKAVAAPVKSTGPSKPVHPTTKHSVAPTKPAPVAQTHEARNKASHKTETKTQHQTADKAQGRAAQAHGSLKALGKTSMLKKPHSPKAAAAQSQKGKSTRSSAQQVTGKAKEAVSHAKIFEQPQPTTRLSRSQTRSQAMEPAIKKTQGKEPVAKPEKTKAPGKLATETPAVEPVPSEVSADHSISLSKVTLRGSASDSMDSFAPSDCTFTAPANLTSFVFKPLSPASAASFLFSNQESSTSFLDTKPNRASTPKSADKEKESTDANTTDKTITQETVVKQAEEKETVSPVKTRSKRRSVGSTVDSSSENETSVPTPARSSRRTRASVLPTVSETDTSSESEVPEVEKNMIATPSQSVKRPRRSLRRSVIMNSFTEQPVSSEEEMGSPAKRRRSSRQSVTSFDTQDVEVNESKNKDSSKQIDTKTPPRSSRRSSRKSNICEVSEEKMEVEENLGETEQTESNTPSRSCRKSVRKSSANKIAEETINSKENEQNKTETLEGKNTVSTPNWDSDSKKEGGTGKRAARAKFFNSSTKENTTPVRQKGRAGRKSFGGFAMPDSNSCVLSAKRKARKSMMPKSPEEWVDLLSHSPMVEMTRRTPKTSGTKSPNGSIPPLYFDDIDLENLPPQPVFTSPSAKEGSTGSEPTVSENPARDGMAHDRSLSVSPRPGISGVASVSNEAISPCSERRRTRSISNGTASPGQGSAETVSKIAEETLQVEEISSTLDSRLSDDLVRVRYFRDLLSSESERLRKLCKLWDDYNNFTEDLTEEARGQIRTVIGQAVLLMNERFKQFSGLVDNCEFKTGEKETTVTDLQGFWDMIYFQVEDVTVKFERLEKLQKNSWVDDKPEPVKKVIKKKVAKPAAPKLNVKSKFAAFRAQMKKQQVAGSPVAQKEEEKVFEVPGFFKVASPVKSPRPHCEAGTPKKAMQTDDATDICAKDNLKVPSDQPGSEELLKRTPARKSYVPAVPSPLLQDSTPLPRPVRSCTKKTPIPKRLLEETDSATKTEVDLPDSSDIETDTGKGKKTPKSRRSLRPRKSVTFNEKVDSALGDSSASMTIDSPVSESSDADFARLLQPMTALQETNIANEADDSFSKYLQPSKSLNVSVEKENTPKQETGRRRRPSLKSTKSSEKRRSRAQSVHFVSPVREQESSQMLPHTPYNRDSLVKQKRVTRHSESSATKVDVFDIENIDNDDDTVPSFGANSRRSARPSLLYTPPHRQTLTPSNKNVPTATLISFSP